jgi:hypothetical protein
MTDKEMEMHAELDFLYLTLELALLRKLDPDGVVTGAEQDELRDRGDQLWNDYPAIHDRVGRFSSNLHCLEDDPESGWQKSPAAAKWRARKEGIRGKIVGDH